MTEKQVTVPIQEHVQGILRWSPNDFWLAAMHLYYLMCAAHYLQEWQSPKSRRSHEHETKTVLLNEYVQAEFLTITITTYENAAEQEKIGLRDQWKQRIAVGSKILMLTQTFDLRIIIIISMEY